jgi:hypothetical protein
MAILPSLLVVFFAQLLYFCAMIGGGAGRENKKVDVVLVYEGNLANVPAGFREATRLHCPRIVFSSMRKAYHARKLACA